MSIQKLKKKLVTRLQELIAEGEGLPSFERRESLGASVDRYGNVDSSDTTRTYCEAPLVGEWRVKCATITAKLFPEGHPHRVYVKQFQALKQSKSQVSVTIATLRAFKNDLETGMLDDLFLQLEAEVAADYLGQAQQLLDEGGTGVHDHVPAAVLLGAVLERSLRALCERQRPPIEVHVNRNGRKIPKKADTMISDLKKASLYSEVTAKQLRAWYGIRSAAAHGDWAKFTRADVESMQRGVEGFLAEHM